MQKHAAVFRNTEILDEGVKKLGDIAMDMNNVRIQDKSLIWNTELIETLELDNLMGQALVTIRSASERKDRVVLMRMRIIQREMIKTG